MAEEKEKKEGEEEEEQPKKSKKKLLIILVVVVLGGAVGAMKFLGIGPFKKAEAPATEEVQKKEEKQPPKPKVEVGPMVTMEPIIVNLADPSGRRYVKVTMTFELDSDAVKKEFEERLPQIKDLLITLLRSKTSAELNDPGGIFRLKEEIVSRINTLLVTGKVKRVYFTDFVIQ